ncbi:flavin reductase family protein [Telmatospirillum sp. J64-1]|uniref:flavin reductase family protein n=1 Tax=Telmatospirillum sp. J64-1 TaxID=2502183 RepID=UPI00115E8EE7|nr:flavin reductase family protein [Telmatospirillum sp. J64-1]
MDAEAFKSAMSHFASSVTVVTTDGAAGRAGVTVSAACSVSAEPPSLLVCIHHLSPAAEAIVRNGRFCVNLLAAGQDRVADCFAGRVAEFREDKFAAVQTVPTPGGCPAIKGATVAFDCKLAEVHRFGTHRLLLGLVEDVREIDDIPLLYANRNYHTIGPIAPAGRA